MDAARALRDAAGESDVLVTRAMKRIAEVRREQGDRTYPSNHAFILRSLKHPAEVRALRGCYGHSFLLIGVHSTDTSRRKRLRTIIQKSSGLPEQAIADVAQYLIQRDSYEEDAGQRVRDTFHLADVFVDGDASEPDLDQQIKRFLRLAFSYPCITPTADEYNMFLAHTASTRTVSLARQVGAAVASTTGEVLALGSNELPKPGGGLVFENDQLWAAMRDAKRGFDTSHREKNLLVADLAKRLKLNTPLDKLIELLKQSAISDIIEFYREVHAETAALLDAARRGVPTNNTSLFVTTFPCHDCAKHILAAGVQRIVYLAPYPKSRTLAFFADAFRQARESSDDRVLLEPFAGVGPRVYHDVFSITTSQGREYPRKDSQGNVLPWSQTYRWRTWEYLNDEAQLIRKEQKSEKQKKRKQ
jgi:deoxycytidylate deaminase